jgi:hypothetical protein
MLSLIVLLILQWAIVSYTINKFAEGQLIQRLQHEAETLLAGTHFDSHGIMTLDARNLSAIYQRPFS